MNTVLWFTLSVFVLFFSQPALGTEADEEETALATFSFPTMDETWNETVELLFSVMFSEECTVAFFEHTGRTPEEVFMDDNVEMVFPNPGSISGLLGANVCAPTAGRSRMAINMAYVQIMGPQHSANTIIHELVHAALCGEETERCLEERIACTVANACIPTGDDCKKLYRECKRNK